MPTLSVIVNSLEEMHSFGKTLGEQLKPGDILLLNGTLGAGKTSLVQGIAGALGITGVTSPTFVISRIYPGTTPLIHVDAYRLVGEPWALFDDLDLESQTSNAITVIEWGDGFVERIADEYLEVKLEFGSEDDQRILTAVGHGPRWLGFKL
ncbi:MAG: tRNA (adenosine(37)-N6)-threonylcarbamoyltransferase complex ATPase subunit type 1 TsaE [Actinomycetes bacterium]